MGCKVLSVNTGNFIPNVYLKFFISDNGWKSLVTSQLGIENAIKLSNLSLLIYECLLFPLKFMSKSLDISSQSFCYLQSVGRTSGSQIVSEEVVSSCSGGPRGNEQLSIFCFFP